ncbi:MAG: ABC transporter permease [Anaerolineae bacterium]|nr:ABC transporter permease [Anaerolineae bacterium]MCA9886714.1 ABC transporter permease [Anaerolineae bacterium]MCA9891339.1 ABC transporter permease [Anaerolineae bacterium]MCB9460103.1 ABC transporter permease [Anaerolineaceae bacterium]
MPYFVRRLIMFVVVVIFAATLNFIIPRLAPGDPISSVLEELRARGQTVQAEDDIVAVYRERFGLDKPLHEQYISYLVNTLQFDLGYSISYFPQTVESALLNALPWTIGLLAVSTFMAFALGTLLGALLAWPRAPQFLQGLIPLFMLLSAIPYYLLALLLMYVFGFLLKVLPLGGAYTSATVPSLSLPFILDVIKHGILPGLSITLAGLGFWALGMRGTMVTIQGEDYLTLAEAKGLRDRRIFFGYAVRNALLPQITALAIALGSVASGAVLVEVVFNYPGVGWLLYNALRSSDYYLIQGVAFFLVLTVALAVLVVDLIYPLLDPRIVR